MPELPEVETIVAQLRARMLGWRVARVRVTRKDIVHGDPRPLERVLVGRSIVDIHRRAKRIIVELDSGIAGHLPAINDSGVQIVVHLGMSGRLLLQHTSDPSEPHTHVRIEFVDEAMQLRFRDPRRFGGVWCLTGSETYRGKVLGPLGPEPLTLRASTFRRLLNRKRQIKAVLLDQAVIAGLGNIYCDEALFDARVHPQTRACDLDEKRASKLLVSIKRTLRQAIKHNGSTLMDYRLADGEPGSFQKLHRVYGREGQACRRCGGEITRSQIAGRSSFVCGICQVWA